MSASTYEIRLLGGFEVRGAGEGLGFHTQKTRALLAYLALHPNQSQSRAKLAGLLWPESTEARAAQSLRQSLSFLRRVFDPALLEVTRQAVTFVPVDPVWIDVVRFQETINMALSLSALTHEEASALSQTADLYRGDLLAGFFLEDAPEFETWLVAVRENLHRLALTALERLGEYHNRRGEYTTARTHLARAITLDPWHEAAHRGLMRALALSGNLAGALAQYEKGRAALLEGLGVEPTEDTQMLYAEIRAGAYEGRSAIPVPASRPEPPFAGRAEAHARLATVLALLPHRSSASHIPTLILLEGEGGAGKTRLMEEFSRYAASQGARHVTGRAYEFSARLPYQPFIEILRGLLPKEEKALWRNASLQTWLPELARLLPELRGKYAPPPSGRDARQHLFEAVLHTLLVFATAKNPLLLFLDDLHWADEPTLDLLHFLVRQGAGMRATPSPLLFLGTYRPEETPGSHPLTQLRRGLSRDHLVETVPVPPLTPEDIHTIATSLFPASDADFTTFLIRQSEGNPFVLTETLHALFDRGAIWLDEKGLKWHYNQRLLTESERLPEMISTPSLEDTILRRVDRLPRETRAPLAVAAVIGRSFDARLLRELISHQITPSEDANFFLNTWLDHRLITTPHPDVYDFTHDKIRETLYHRLPDGKRRALHGDVAVALERLHTAEIETVAPTVAHHFQLGPEPRRALPYLRLAALQAAEALAFVHVVRYCTQALDTSTGETSPLSASLAAGEPDDDRDARFNFLDMRQRAYQHLGQTTEEGADAEAMRALAEQREDHRQLALANERLALFYARRGDMPEARSAGWKAVAAAKRAGESILQVKSLVPLAMLIRDEPGGQVQAMELLKNALEQARRMDTPNAQAFVMGHLAILFEERGDFEQALRHFKESERLMRGAEDFSPLASCLFSLAGTCRLMGLFAEAEAALAEARQLTEELDLRGIQLPVSLGMGRLALAQEQVGEAQAAFEWALTRAVQFQRPVLEAQALWGLGVAARLSGGFQQARIHLERAHTLFPPTEVTLIAVTLADLSHTFLGMRDLDGALEASRQAVAALEAGGETFVERQKIYWARYRVLLEAGQPSEAAQWLEKAQETILQQADKLDEAHRTVFLELIPLHRTILLEPWDA